MSVNNEKGISEITIKIIIQFEKLDDHGEMYVPNQDVHEQAARRIDRWL